MSLMPVNPAGLLLDKRPVRWREIHPLVERNQTGLDGVAN